VRHAPILFDHRSGAYPVADTRFVDEGAGTVCRHEVDHLAAGLRYRSAIRARESGHSSAGDDHVIGVRAIGPA
jgi:hypothetical protein